MNKDTVDNINLDKDVGQKNRASIGMKNVKQRFVMSFPKSSEFIVYSKMGFGTVIKMIICNEKEHEDV